MNPQHSQHYQELEDYAIQAARGVYNYQRMIEPMMTYYKYMIQNKPEWLKAITTYKGSGYSLINQLLLKKVELKTGINYIRKTKNSLEIMRERLKNIWEMKECVQSLDVILAGAPQVSEETIVYRGVSKDPVPEIFYCEGERVFVKFPNFLSTALNPGVTTGFASPEESGVLFVITLPIGTRGLFLFDLFPDVTHPNEYKLEEKFVDRETELLLPRDCIFELERIELQSSPDRSQTLKQATCLQHVKFRKCYYLRLVEQPTLEMYVRDYATLFKNGTVKLSAEMSYALPLILEPKIDISDPESPSLPHPNIPIVGTEETKPIMSRTTVPNALVPTESQSKSPRIKSPKRQSKNSRNKSPKRQSKNSQNKSPKRQSKSPRNKSPRNKNSRNKSPRDKNSRAKSPKRQSKNPRVIE